jgi:hypothetical protein
LRFTEDGELRDGIFVAALQAELEPIADGLGNGVAVAAIDLAVFVVADDLP